MTIWLFNTTLILFFLLNITLINITFITLRCIWLGGILCEMKCSLKMGHGVTHKSMLHHPYPPLLTAARGLLVEWMMRRNICLIWEEYWETRKEEMVKLELFTIEFLYLFTIEYSCDFLSLLNPYLTIPQKKKILI